MAYQNDFRESTQATVTESLDDLRLMLSVAASSASRPAVIAARQHRRVGARAAKTNEPRMNARAVRLGVYLRLNNRIPVLFAYVTYARRC